jgi:hypothetical protein
MKKFIKTVNPKNIFYLYKVNRSYGDNPFEATYYALRGKSFPVILSGSIE